MSYEKHNRWRRIIPEGWSTTKLKNKLAKTALNGRDRGILRLALDCAPPPPDHEYDIRDAIAWRAAIDAGLKPPTPLQRPSDDVTDSKKYFHLSVKYICSSLNFDPLKTWPRARKRLEACVSKCGKKKLLQIGFKPLSGGEYQWFLAFDFTCLVDGSLDAPPEAKRNKKQNMKNDKLNKKWGGHANPPVWGGHDPVILAGSEPIVEERAAFEPNTNTGATSTPPHAGGQAKPPSPLPSPLPLPASVVSPPPLGGGVLESFSKIKLLDDSVFCDLKNFNDFSVQHGLNGINVHHQRRNKIDTNGRIGRGGTFNPFLQNDYSQLCWVVRRAAARSWELGCSGGQFLLLDDLNFDSVKEFMAEKLTVCILETSVGNYQALLPKIGSWTDIQVKAAQINLSQQFGGDANAVSSRQPHRLPGSINLKNNDCFVTKLSCIQYGKILDPLNFGGTDIVKKSELTAKEKKQGHRNDSGYDNTASGQDFGMVCKMLKTEKVDQEILNKLLASCQERGKKGSHQKYADLTLKNARTHLKM